MFSGNFSDFNTKQIKTFRIFANPKKELKILGWIVTVFVFSFFLPAESPRFTTAVMATFDLVKWYAREHVVLCTCYMQYHLLMNFLAAVLSPASIISV